MKEKLCQWKKEKRKMTNKLSTRKIILLSLIAILLVVYIFQLVASGRNDGYKISLKEIPDTILIQNGTNPEIKIENSNGTWLLKEGSENPEEKNMIIPAKAESVKSILDGISNISVLGLVSKNSDNDRYGFTTDNIKVQVLKDGKILRTLELGKNSASYQQVYGKVDDSNDVLLISGNPRLTFGVTFENLKALIDNPSVE